MGEPLKKNALVPSERSKVCDHPSGFAYSGSVPCTGPRVCHLCETTEHEADRAKAEKELRLVRTQIKLSATMTIECPECDGEGGHEGPITCTGRCDWCGGCRDQSSPCDTCTGSCEVEEDELDAQHLLSRQRLIRRYIVLRHAMAAEDGDTSAETWTELGEYAVMLANVTEELEDSCEAGDFPSEWD